MSAHAEMKSQSVTELSEGIKQLIVGSKSLLQNTSSMEEARRMYMHLEEYDRNFHRYSLVKYLRAQIEEAVGSQIDDELCNHGDEPNDLMGSGQESLVNIVASRVMESPAYLEMADRTERRVQLACEHLTRNFDQEFPRPVSGRSGGHHTHWLGGGSDAISADVLFSDTESTIEDTSSCYSGPSYFNSEKQEVIAKQLKPDSNVSVQTRLDALRQLLQVLVSFEPQNIKSGSWTEIRSGVRASALSNDDQLVMAALKVISRGFTLNNSISGEIGRDLYITLGETLSSIFSDSRVNLPKLRQGIDCSEPQTKKILKMIRLMNDYQLEVTHYWQRYPVSMVEELQRATLDFLTLTLHDSDHVTPLHLLSLVDPGAKWFIKFMHTYHSRSALLRLLAKDKSFVRSALQSCYDYSSALDQLSMTNKSSKASNARNVSRGVRVYIEGEAEGCLFIHSLSVISRLLLYKSGRKIFPLRIRLQSNTSLSAEDPVTVSDMLVTLISVLTRQQQRQQQQQQQPVKTSARSTNTDTDDAEHKYSVGELIVSLLRELCSKEEVCSDVMCRDVIIQALLEPITRWIQAAPASDDTPRASDWSLVHITEVLSAVACSSCGRKYLLYGDVQSDDSSTPVVHMLLRYSRLALDKGLVPQAVTAELVFVCRQLYSTCDGLLMSLPYQLHSYISAAYINAKRDKATTPTSITTTEKSAVNQSARLEWEEMLCDNLLSFAVTPRGLQLLVTTSMLDDCTRYMYSRYVRKLQVSKCEKFGYGYMLSQIAATLPGIRALNKSGFVEAHVHALWSVIEMVDDEISYTQRAWPVTCLDKSAVKPFNNIINLISCYHCVYELLSGKQLPSAAAAVRPAADSPLYSHRVIPQTLLDLMDRIVLMDSSSKILSLFNYEQSHVMGLMILNVLVSCLDTMLLLLSQYQYQQTLLQSQSLNTTPNSSSKQIIVDMLSLWRNHILVRSYLVGGASERLLPPCTLSNPSHPYPHPLFSTYPPPPAYTLRSESTSKGKEDSEFSRFLATTRKADVMSAAWLESCKTSVCSLILSKPDQLTPALVMDLLEKCVDSQRHTTHKVFLSHDPKVSEDTLKNLKLTSVQQLGIELTLRYAHQIGITVSSNESQTKLPLLIKKSCAYLKQQQVKSLVDDSAVCGGFDWFTATMFLLMGGNSDRAWRFLSQFSSLLTSAYLWFHRLHRSVHLSDELLRSGVPPVHSLSCHLVESLLQSELPQVYSAFKLSGFSPAQICMQWIRQCFWNYLDWREIREYVTLCVVRGCDYQIYTCIALFKHLQPVILSHSIDKSLITALKTEPVRGFTFREHLSYMMKLQKKYQSFLLKHLSSITTQQENKHEKK